MDNNFLMPEYEDGEETPIFVPEKNEEPTVQLEEEVIQPASSGEMLMPDYNEDDIVNETEVAKDTTTFKVPTVEESNAVLEKEVKEKVTIDERIQKRFESERSRREGVSFDEETISIRTKNFSAEQERIRKLALAPYLAMGQSEDEALASFKEKVPDSIIFQDAETETINQADEFMFSEKAKDKLIGFLNSSNAITSGLTEQLLDSDLTMPEINAIVSTDEFLNPVTILANMPKHYADVQEAIKVGDYKGAAKAVGWGSLDALAAIPLTKVVTKSVNTVWKKAGGGKEYNRVQQAMTNESDIAEGILKANKIKANENKELRDKLIREFEERTNVVISTVQKNGHLKVDPALVRQTGKQKVTDYYYNDKYVGSDDKKLGLDDLAIGDDDLAIPILNPNKLDALVGVVADLQKLHPDALKVKKNERLVDRLFDLTLNKELLASEELLKVINKHGMSFEEYMLGVVGSGSQAGKLLNKIGQLKRIKPMSVKEQQAEAAKNASQKAIAKFWQNTVLRGENIRRGLMVSSLATAARNLQSGLIRSPMESLGDVMDTAMITYAKGVQEGDRFGGVVGATKNIVPFMFDSTWSGSFRNMRYILGDQNSAKQFTDYILDRPELSDQMSRMFNNIGEIQQLTGRGSAVTKVGKGLDAIAGKIEDGVAFLNKPNLWQDHMIRRATFYSELQRLTKANYNIDLQDTLNSGRIQDLLNDASDLRPKGAPSFVSMLDDSVKKALDVTYASEPDFVPFKTMSRLITKSGLTVIVPFPRFMFKALETMAQYTGGGALVAMRKAISKDSRAGGFVARDRQDISRNLVGLGAITAMYQYRTMDGVSSDYTSMDWDGKQVDITAQYPLRQISWLAEFAKRSKYTGGNDTTDVWNGMSINDITETWLGSSARTGTGNVFLQEIGSLISGASDDVDEARREKTIGRLVGQYVNTFLTPIFQLSEAQRVGGDRTNEYKDSSGDPILEGNFAREFHRSLGGRGIQAPSTEEALPTRMTIDKGPMQRPNAALKLFAGLTVRERDSDITDYLIEIGYGDPTYELGSKSRIPSERRKENEYISMSLPMVVDLAKEMSQSTTDNKKDEYTKARKFVTDFTKGLRTDYRLKGISSPLATSIEELSRVPKVDRKYGMLQFEKISDEPFDVTNVTHIQLVIGFAESIY